ncbi:ABC transporter substrate-binding protein [Streptomyces daliensis]|uniref:ABC transporter substrate-binding protein n=1 Tax=Streptomyces daliensis TaxID=299421 RepID=A0A8T4IRN3_9ACTN|nr:ABC transporter substrate-binding protein [Streptomyces daliensis]
MSPNRMRVSLRDAVDRARDWGRLRKLLAAALLVAVLGAGGWALWTYFGPDPSCGPGVEKRGEDEECTGVTDGSGGVSFTDELEPVMRAIARENERIADKEHATVAIMVPVSTTDPVVKKQIRREVQGAYLAQYRANHRSNAQSPPIRLVLANPGHDSAHWRPVADQLVAMAHDGHNLRAVTGFDLSVRRTQDTIDYLTNEKGIPVVGGPITADNLANTAKEPDRYRGLARVVPTNSDQAKALANFNKGIKASRTLLVEDRREDDNYVQTLKQAFQEQTRNAPQIPMQYESPADMNDEGRLPNDFSRMVNNICDSDAEVIYFAGRPVHLRLFVNALGGRGCDKKTYKVVTGSGASTLATDSELNWDALAPKGGITVEYASVAHPDAWSDKRAPDTGGSREAVEELEDLARTVETDGSAGPVGPVELDDSRTISAYDSAWTAITAIRNQTGQKTPMPSTDDVRRAWLNLRGSQKVVGASGWICLDNAGNPYNKAVAVVHLNPSGPKIDFVGLAWPENKPPDEHCTAPNKPGE